MRAQRISPKKSWGLRASLFWHHLSESSSSTTPKFTVSKKGAIGGRKKWVRFLEKISISTKQPFQSSHNRKIGPEDAQAQTRIIFRIQNNSLKFLTHENIQFLVLKIFYLLICNNLGSHCHVTWVIFVCVTL